MRDDVVQAVAAELRALAVEEVAPEAALPRMRALGQRLGAPVQLLFSREPYGDGWAYDAVVDEAGGAFVVRYCAERGVPFLLHAAERLGDRELLRVDGQALLVRDAVALLDFVWSERPLMRRLVDVCIIQAELERAPVEVDDAAVQAALDRLRATHGLYDAEATRRWMAERNLTHARLERWAVEQAEILALRDRLVGGDVEAHFAAHAADYDRALVARMTVPADARGRAFAEEVAAARLPLPAVEELLRGALAPALRRAVFDEPPGPLRVVRDGEALTLVQVESVTRAVLDDATRDRIADELFAAWLGRRRAAARIDWNWGHVERTRLD
jgi:putative peptide maturation system protein